MSGRITILRGWNLASGNASSTRRSGLKRCLAYIHALSLSDVLWIDRRHNGLPQNILLVRADLLPVFSAAVARAKLIERGCGFQLVRASRKPFPEQALSIRLGFLLRANGRKTAGRRPALAGRLLCGNALWVFAFSTQMPLASAEYYGVFDFPRERRKKRADVEIFRPILAKFSLSQDTQKRRTACSCGYMILNYRI